MFKHTRIAGSVGHKHTQSIRTYHHPTSRRRCHKGKPQRWWRPRVRVYSGHFWTILRYFFVLFTQRHCKDLFLSLFQWKVWIWTGCFWAVDVDQNLQANLSVSLGGAILQSCWWKLLHVVPFTSSRGVLMTGVQWHGVLPSFTFSYMVDQIPKSRS